MGFEDREIANTGGAVSTMRYGLGARGLDLLERVTSSGTTTVFPLYDCHGNNVASLSRSGTSYALADQRVYDAWGRVRNTTATGDPRSRFCASLGHKTDDESDLIYMRARYYEPLRGRFISEDSQGAGGNWYTYCVNDPVNKVDESGNTPESSLFWAVFGLTCTIGALFNVFESSITVMMKDPASRIILASGAAMLVTWFGLGDPSWHRNGDWGDRVTGFSMLLTSLVGTAMLANVALQGEGVAGNAVNAVSAYVLIIGLFMAFDCFDDTLHGVVGVG
jgi:RHS repeat-associated protein